jgi:hypothetical protein
MIGRIWFPLVLLLTLLYLIVEGMSTLPIRGMLFPLIIGGICILLSASEVIRGFSKEKCKDEEDGNKKLKNLRPFIPSLLILLAIAPVVWILGFMVAIPLHVFFYLKYNNEKWGLSAAIAISLAIIFYFGLYIGMKIPFNEGLLFEYLKG